MSKSQDEVTSQAAAPIERALVVGAGTMGSGIAQVIAEAGIQVTLTDAESGGPVTLPIANQTVWRREDGVGWKIVSEHNSALPSASAGAEAAPAG